MTETEAVELADVHLRKVLDAYGHHLYPAALAKTFGQKGKVQALAVKLVEDEEKWTALLKAVDDRVDLLEQHKKDHWDLLQKAREENQEMEGYVPPDEEELVGLLPREYVEFIGKEMAPAEATEQAAPAAPVLRAEDLFPTSVAAPPTEGEPTPPDSVPPSRRSVVTSLASYGAAILVGAAIGYFARGFEEVKPSIPPPGLPGSPPPAPRPAWVGMLINGKNQPDGKCEVSGKVTVSIAKDAGSVTVFVTSVAEPAAKPAPEPKPKPKEKPKPKPRPKPTDSFPSGWEVQ